MIRAVAPEVVLAKHEEISSDRLHFTKRHSGRVIDVIVRVDDEGNPVLPEPTWYRVNGERKLNRRIATIDVEGDVINGYSDAV